MKESGFGGGILLVLTFFLITPVALVTSVYALVSFNEPEKVGEVIGENTENLISAPQSGVQVFASLPGQMPSVNVGPVIADARTEIVRQYLERYNSPLEPYAGDLVRIADKYGVDFRLTTAIAQQESNLCKKYPVWTHNCWGYGIHSAGTLGFNNFVDGIETVTKGIRENYMDEGLVTPEEIMSKWVPHSPEGAWAKGVSAFMEEME